MKRLLVAALLPLAMLSACTRDPVARLKKDPNVLAVVGCYEITRADLTAAAAYNQADTTQDPWVQSRVWDDLVDALLVLNDRAPEPSGEPPRPLGDLSDPQARENVVDSTLDERVYAKAEVSDREIEAYYRDHRDEFQRGPGVLLRQMLLPGSTQAGDAEALLRRGHSFVDVARLYSLSPDRGALQYFQYSELPDYLKPVIDEAKTGAPTAPLRLSGSSYQILLVEGRHETYLLPEDEVAPEIRLRLSDERREELKARYLADLHRRFRTVVFWSKLPFAYQKETP